jgi:putative membrane protein
MEASAGGGGRISAGRALLLTVGVSAAAYALLGYALTRRPPTDLSPAVRGMLSLLPTVIAAVNATALTCLLAGWRAIRAGRVEAHRRFMLAAVGLIAVFLVLYVTRVALGGVKVFPGPAQVRRYVYLPALAVHVTLSILTVPPVVYNVLTGLTRPPGQVRTTGHPRVGRVAVILWSVSLSLGLLVYLLLNVVY